MKPCDARQATDDQRRGRGSTGLQTTENHPRLTIKSHPNPQPAGHADEASFSGDLEEIIVQMPALIAHGVGMFIRLIYAFDPIDSHAGPRVVTQDLDPTPPHVQALPGGHILGVDDAANTHPDS